MEIIDKIKLLIREKYEEHIGISLNKKSSEEFISGVHKVLYYPTNDVFSIFYYKQINIEEGEELKYSIKKFVYNKS